LDNHKFLNKRRWLREFLLSCLLLLIIFYTASRLDLSDKLYAFSRAHEAVDLGDMLLSLGLFLPIFIVFFAIRRFRELTILVRESSTDGLTGLINHRHVQGLLAQQASRAQRFRRPLSVVLFDIDNFKQINDTHGHPVGDAVLRQVATLMLKAVREVDYLARTGGEEFMLIATETPGHPRDSSSRSSPPTRSRPRTSRLTFKSRSRTWPATCSPARPTSSRSRCSRTRAASVS
jgi:GGDEF domain-containing protein